MNLSTVLEDRAERKIEKREAKVVNRQAALIAESIAFSTEPTSIWGFNIGKAPKTMSVIDFARRVGEATVSRLDQHTSLNIAEFDLPQTADINSWRPGIGHEKLEAIPPPEVDVTVKFERTPEGELYKF